MGSCGGSTCHSLPVDVGKIEHTLADFSQWSAKVTKSGTGAERRLHTAVVVIQNATELIDDNKMAIGRHQGTEGMAGAHRSQRAASTLQNVAKLVFTGDVITPGRLAL